jgi:hypothetical protein
MPQGKYHFFYSVRFLITTSSTHMGFLYKEVHAYLYIFELHISFSFLQKSQVCRIMSVLLDLTQMISILIMTGAFFQPFWHVKIITGS